MGNELLPERCGMVRQSLRQVVHMFPGNAGQLDLSSASFDMLYQSRAVCAIHPFGYSLLNALPFLRTHVLCWIPKRS